MAQHDRPGGGTGRSIRPVDALFAIVGANRSVLHAASWLIKAGAGVSGAESIKAAAKAEQTPRICRAIGLFSKRGVSNICLTLLILAHQN